MMYFLVRREGKEGYEIWEQEDLDMPILAFVGTACTDPDESEEDKTTLRPGDLTVIPAVRARTVVMAPELDQLIGALALLKL